MSLHRFSPLTTDDVIAGIQRLPDKHSAAQFIAELFNRSMSEGRFPAAFKEAFITPTVKKAGMDATDVSSYRTISNLSVLSKLLERLITHQLMQYLSSFRSGHSTETAVLPVLSDIF